MKHNNLSFLCRFYFRIALFSLVIFFSGIHSAFIGPKFEKFRIQGFTQEEPFCFKNNLKIITNCFDSSGEGLLEELDSIISTKREEGKKIKLRESADDKDPVWESFSKNSTYQILSFDKKFESYFKNTNSPYNIKLDDFKQSKNLLLEILRYTRNRIFLEGAFLRLDKLVDGLEVFDFRDPKIDPDENNINYVLKQKIKSKKNYIQKKIIQIALIIEFRSQLFRFIQHYFEENKYTKELSTRMRLFNRNYLAQAEDFRIIEIPPQLKTEVLLILNKLDNKEKACWIHDLNIQNHVGILVPFTRAKDTLINTAKNTYKLLEDSEKFVRRLVLKGKPVNTTITLAQERINSSTYAISKFGNINMGELEDKIRRIPEFVGFIKDQPAVWRISTFLLKIVPRILINRISPKAKLENQIEDETTAAVKKLTSLTAEKKNLSSLAKILRHLVKATGAIHPAINFLERVQSEVFNDIVPRRLAEQIIKLQSWLLEISNGFQIVVDSIKALKQASEVDEKNEELANKTTLLSDWVNIFKHINKETSTRERKNFYESQLPVLTFLRLIPNLLPLPNFFSNQTIPNMIREANPLIQDHLVKVHDYINSIPIDYLYKIHSYKKLQHNFAVQGLNTREYGKIMLFVAALKNIGVLFKTDTALENDELAEENSRKIFYHAFPGTQQLAFLINNKKAELKKESIKKTKFKAEYEKAIIFSRQHRLTKQLFLEGIKNTDYFHTRLFTKITLLLIRLLSFFIDRKNIFKFCNRFKIFNNLLLREDYNDFQKSKFIDNKTDQCIQEYEKIDTQMAVLNQMIREKETFRKELKDFRKDLKNKIDAVWNLR